MITLFYESAALAMRMLAPPTPAPDTPSTMNGRAAPFTKVGCVHCHTPSLTTGKMIASGSSTVPSASLSNQTANLFCDLLVHHMGRGLADGVTQGGAGPDEFRTAPLWGVGQRASLVHAKSMRIRSLSRFSSVRLATNGTYTLPSIGSAGKTFKDLTVLDGRPSPIEFAETGRPFFGGFQGLEKNGLDHPGNWTFTT